jgi:de-etiolated-1
MQNGSQMLRGLKQRLLSFILQGIQNDDISSAVKAQRLKRFYYHFQHYVDLVMWKVQFLDRCHLLIKFGSVDGVGLKNSEASHQTAFLAVYNMETTEILSFYQNSSEELLQLVEQYWDHFRVVPQNPLYMNFISSYANNSFAREQLRKQRNASLSGKAGSYTQAIKRTLASVPHNSQSQSPSAYFDQYLFHYDEKLISSTDRHKPCPEHPIKFISRRRPNSLKFKINPGLELDSNDGNIKRVASFLFHPIYPFAISVQQSFMQSSVVNFHFRR